MKNANESPEISKAAICIKEMSKQVGLSRQRFMQLVKSGVFPEPLRDEQTRRPYYTDELQSQCLDVRRRNCGINGRVVMFYARRVANTTPSIRPKILKLTKSKPVAMENYSEIIAGLHGLGLVTATNSQVSDTIAKLFPSGIAGLETGNVIRSVFLQLKGKN